MNNQKDTRHLINLLISTIRLKVVFDGLIEITEDQEFMKRDSLLYNLNQIGINIAGLSIEFREENEDFPWHLGLLMVPDLCSGDQVLEVFEDDIYNPLSYYDEIRSLCKGSISELSLDNSNRGKIQIDKKTAKFISDIGHNSIWTVRK